MEDFLDSFPSPPPSIPPHPKKKRNNSSVKSKDESTAFPNYCILLEISSRSHHYSSTSIIHPGGIVLFSRCYQPKSSRGRGGGFFKYHSLTLTPTACNMIQYIEETIPVRRGGINHKRNADNVSNPVLIESSLLRSQPKCQFTPFACNFSLKSDRSNRSPHRLLFKVLF